ncbi:hypothetical protein E8E14_006574 [Neopestalotiopsis sp. 37M]|nr:hypothetical protein E8E14_006574 [Neopestalotiopsis sp. 37M]
MDDTLMSGTFVPEILQDTPAPALSTAGPSKRRKTRYSNLDWDGHKARLQDLYLVQNNSLVETMRIMKEEHEFEATPRVYKDKFKQWGWQKNLPARHAQFMVKKAAERKRKEHKDTIFEYGGQLWDSVRAKNTLNRAKKVAYDDDVIDMNTPASIAYQSPDEAEPSQPSDPLEGPDDYTREVSSNESESQDHLYSGLAFGSPNLLLSWQGSSRTDLDKMLQAGRRLAEQNQQDRAEELMLMAYQGMCHILGETNEDTTKAAYLLADLYTLQGRPRKADTIIEEMTRKHVEILGYEHKKTQKHIFRCVELLNAWNRSFDALAFITRAKEILDWHQKDPGRWRQGTSNDKGKSASKFDLESPGISRSSELPKIADNDPSQIDSYLERAKLHVQEKDDATEVFLEEIIRQCEKYHDTLPVQHLQARSELLKLYISTNRVFDNFPAFANARATCADILSGYNWDEYHFKSIEVMEAVLEVASDILKGGYNSLASPLFHRVSEIAAGIFHIDDERTIWILITIGIAYQNIIGWSQAQEWFERAFAGALSAFGPKTGIILLLRHAMDKKHFSFLSDEGRPFQTISGIFGLTIWPGRLHLDQHQYYQGRRQQEMPDDEGESAIKSDLKPTAMSRKSDLPRIADSGPSQIGRYFDSPRSRVHFKDEEVNENNERKFSYYEDHDTPPSRRMAEWSRALCGGNVEDVMGILRNGVDVNALVETPDDLTFGRSNENFPLCIASERSYTLTKLLLDAGAEVDVNNVYSGTPLQITIHHKSEKAESIASLLLEYGADINAPPGALGTALEIAIATDNIHLAAFLIARGADVNKFNWLNSSTALTTAIRMESLPMLKLLLSHGAVTRATGISESDVALSNARISARDDITAVLNIWEAAAEQQTYVSVDNLTTEIPNALLEANLDCISCYWKVPTQFDARGESIEMSFDNEVVFTTAMKDGEPTVNEQLVRASTFQECFNELPEVPKRIVEIIFKSTQQKGLY